MLFNVQKIVISHLLPVCPRRGIVDELRPVVDWPKLADSCPVNAGCGRLTGCVRWTCVRGMAGVRRWWRAGSTPGHDSALLKTNLFRRFPIGPQKLSKYPPGARALALAIVGQDGNVIECGESVSRNV
ncbi:hypothetical protein [Paraburkholderia youngii]|uniref:hypothetical protein n=1 Tax=Paraburkholderia youngii TaxID=2782701 RepID=UPI003D192562